MSHSLPARPQPFYRASRTAFLVLALLWLVLNTFDVRAERADQNQPIKFSADKSEAINYDTKTATLSGNVIITQGTTVIHADRVTFRQNPNNSISATAHGKPVSFRQKRDKVDEFIEAYALRVEYNGEKELLELFDQALLKRENDEIRSDYIAYSTATETFHASARPANGTRTEGAAQTTPSRVLGTFEIKPKTATSKETPQGTAQGTATPGTLELTSDTSLAQPAPAENKAENKAESKTGDKKTGAKKTETPKSETKKSNAKKTNTEAKIEVTP